MNLGLIVALVCLPGEQAAQVDNAMQFTVSNRITDRSPSCTVVVEALWNPAGIQFGAAEFGVFAGGDPGGFADPGRLIFGPGTLDGVVSPDGDSVTGIISGRICSPLDPPCDFAQCPNPEAIWRASWSTNDFTPRVVSLATVTSGFHVIFQQCVIDDLHDDLLEGAGEIIVTCYADCDQSTGLGVLDIFDFLCFVNTFNDGGADADCDGNGLLDLFDFLCFVNAFSNGC